MLCLICGHDTATPNATTCRSCGTPFAGTAPPPHVLSPGSLLLDQTYSVGKVLGQGGFGITYMGSDRRLQRPVAIKEFFPAGCVRQSATVVPAGAWTPVTYAEARQRFVQEGQTLGRFRHSGIVQVHAAFEANDTAYLVMEYVRGQTLEEVRVAHGGRLEEAEVLAYLQRAGEALDVVHEAGLLHRDIKPDNLMVCADGRVVLVDFGTAREFVAGHTQRHSVMITPGYAPLEQYAQQAQRGPYTDVYALAATAYHLLTGVLPVAATDRAAGVDLPPLQQLCPQVSAAVAEAVMAGLAMRTDARPASVRAWLERLRGPRLVVASDGSGAVPTLEEAVRQAVPGTTLVLAAGEYRLARSLLLNKALTLQGADLEQTRLVCEAEGSVLRCEGVGLVQIYDLTVEHRGERWGNVVEVAGGLVDIRRCRFTGGVRDEVNKHGGTGLWLYGQMRGTIAACQAQGNGRHGISVQDEAQPHLEGNHCEGNTSSGLAYAGQAGGQGRGNVCRSNEGSGIAVTDEAQPHLEGNHCEGNTSSGLAYAGQAGGQGRGNVCRSNEGSGIAVTDEAQPHLEGNHCEGNTYSGLRYAGQAGGQGRDNVCRSNGRHGISVQGEAQPHLEGNHCEGNTSSGLRYFAQAGGQGRDNVCRSNGRHGISVQEEAQPHLEGNRCEGNKQQNIYVASTARPRLHDNQTD